MNRETQAMLDLAVEWRDAAATSLDAGRHSVAFSEARHAAELAGKVLLLLAEGSFPNKHPIAGRMAVAGVIPRFVDRRELHKLLAAFTKGEYGALERPTTLEVEEAVETATALIEAAKAWPDGAFHPAVLE